MLEKNPTINTIHFTAYNLPHGLTVSWTDKPSERSHKFSKIGFIIFVLEFIGVSTLPVGSELVRKQLDGLMRWTETSERLRIMFDTPIIFSLAIKCLHVRKEKRGCPKHALRQSPHCPVSQYFELMTTVVIVFFRNSSLVMQMAHKMTNLTWNDFNNYSSLRSSNYVHKLTTCTVRKYFCRVHLKNAQQRACLMCFDVFSMSDDNRVSCCL